MKKFAAVFVFFFTVCVVFSALGCSNSVDSGNTQTPSGDNTQSPNLGTNPLTKDNAEEILAAANGADWRTKESIIIPEGVTSV